MVIEAGGGGAVWMGFWEMRTWGDEKEQGEGVPSCVQRYNTLRDLTGCVPLGSGEEVQGRAVVCLD